MSQASNDFQSALNKYRRQLLEIECLKDAGMSAFKDRYIELRSGKRIKSSRQVIGEYPFGTLFAVGTAFSSHDMLIGHIVDSYNRYLCDCLVRHFELHLTQLESVAALLGCKDTRRETKQGIDMGIDSEKCLSAIRKNEQFRQDEKDASLWHLPLRIERLFVAQLRHAIVHDHGRFRLTLAKPNKISKEMKDAEIQIPLESLEVFIGGFLRSVGEDRYVELIDRKCIDEEWGLYVDSSYFYCVISLIAYTRLVYDSAAKSVGILLDWTPANITT